MSATNEIESYAASWVFPYLQSRLGRGCKVAPVPNNIATQHRYGDKWLTNPNTGKVLEVELKSEQRHTGFLFVELWSDEPNAVQGWLYHYSDNALLAYAFNDSHRLYTCRMGMLRKFCHSKGERGRLKIEDYRAVTQGKYEQKNKPLGRLLPVKDFLQFVEGAKAHHLDPTTGLMREGLLELELVAGSN